MSRAFLRIVSIPTREITHGRALIFRVRFRTQGGPPVNSNRATRGDISRRACFAVRVNAIIQADPSPFRDQFDCPDWRFSPDRPNVENIKYVEPIPPVGVIRKLLHGQFSVHFPVRERYFHDRDTARKCPLDRTGV